MDGHVSNFLPVVPEGLILKSILFALYITDFQNIVQNCEIRHYAAGTQLYRSFDKKLLGISSLHLNEYLNLLFNMSTAHNFSSKSKAFVYDAIKIKSTVDQSRSFLYE